MENYKNELIPRHPEKLKNRENLIMRKPSWIRVKAPNSKSYEQVKKLIREKQLKYSLRRSILSEYR